MEKTKFKSTYCLILAFIVSAFTGLSTLYLFNRFVYSKFVSDFPAHISSAVTENGYSFMHILLKFTFNIFKNLTAISVLMSVITVLTVFVAAYLFKTIIKTVSNGKYNTDTFRFYAFSIVLSALSLFISNIYIPEYWEHYYVGQSTVTQPWHNSTYILMRLFALAVLAVYFVIQQRYYKQKISVGYYIVFLILLALTNFAKPNFSMAFAPIMLLVLLWDFCATKAKSFLNALLFGVCVLISFFPILFQTNSLYGGADGSSIVMSADKYLSFTAEKSYMYSLFADLLFPLLAAIIILVYYLKCKDISLRIFFTTWGFYVLGVLEALFIAETGPRATHGNFGWGQYFFGLLLYLVSIAYLTIIAKKKKEVYFTFIIYGLNIISGIFYFCSLCGIYGEYNNFLI